MLSKKVRLRARFSLAAFLLGGALAMMPTTAGADVVNGQCYDTFEDPEPCSTSDGCRETVYIAYCIVGNSGSSCGHGGGLCCGEIPYSTSSAEGQCETDDAKLAQSRVRISCNSDRLRNVTQRCLRRRFATARCLRPQSLRPLLCCHRARLF
jgi:hypothetical protein